MEMDTNSHKVKRVHVINRNTSDAETDRIQHFDDESEKIVALKNKIKDMSIFNFKVKGIAAQARMKIGGNDVHNAFSLVENVDEYFGQDQILALLVKRALDGGEFNDITYVVSVGKMEDRDAVFEFSNRREFESSFADSSLMLNRLISGVANMLLHQRKLMKHLADHFEDDVAWEEAWPKTQETAKAIFKKKYRQMRKDNAKHKKLRDLVSKMRSYLKQDSLEDLAAQGYDISNI